MIASIYSFDWFKRDANFTRSNKEIKLNWEEGLNDKFSSFIFNNSYANMLNANKFELINELIGIGTNFGLGGRTILINSDNDESCTNGRSIIISNKFDKVTDIYDKLDLVIGLFCHECAHCLYSDFNQVSNDNQIIKWIQNVIEDELIETKLGQFYPGYINFISKVKYYYFDTLKDTILNGDFKNDLDEIMKLMLLVIRYPKYLNEFSEETLNKYATLFEKIYDILKSNICLDADKNKMPTQLSLKAAKEIYELLKKYINESEKSDGNGKKSSSSSEGNNNKESGSKNTADGMGSSEGNTSGENEIGKNEEISEKKSSGSSLFKEMEDEINNSEDSIKNLYEKENNKVTSTSEHTNSITFWDVETMKNKIEEINKAEKEHLNLRVENVNYETISSYNEIYTKIRPFITYAKKMIIQNESSDMLSVERFRRTGMLDSRKIAEAYMGCKNVFTQMQQKKYRNKKSKYALVIMLDESSSMGYNKVFDYTTELAVLIYETLKEYKDMELYIYGHGDVVVPYITKNCKNKEVLSVRKMQGNQCEPVAYEMILDDVKKQTNNPIIAINITDSLYIYDVDKIKKVVDEYKSQGIDINLMCCGHEATNEATTRMNNTVYGVNNWVNIGEYFSTIFKVAAEKIGKIILRNYNK